MKTKQDPILSLVHAEDPEEFATILNNLQDKVGSGQLVKVPSKNRLDVHRCDFPNLKLPKGTKWKCECGRLYRYTKVKTSRYREYMNGNAWRNVWLERRIAAMIVGFLALCVVGSPNAFAIAGLVISGIFSVGFGMWIAMEADCGDHHMRRFYSHWD